MSGTLLADDLLNHPDDIQPIGSKKGISNKPTPLSIDLYDLFTADDNRLMLTNGLHAIYQQNGGKYHISKFRELIPLMMKRFTNENDIRRYETVEAGVVGINNYVEALRAINNAFTKYVYGFFHWNMANPFHDDVLVGSYEARVLKKSYELTPEDHQTLDVWREQFVQVLNNKFRDHNRVPVFRASLHTRHFDRGNEGLQFNDPDRASLENPVRGYDMSQIHKTLGKYSSTEWYGM